MRKSIMILALISLTLMTTATAISWQEQKNIAKETAYKNNYDGDFRYAYYEIKWGNNNSVWIYAEYHIHSDESYDESLITFYSSSLILDKHDFNCLVLHEIGHYKEVKFNQGKRKTILNETYADNYMQRQDNTCRRWYG